MQIISYYISFIQLRFQHFDFKVRVCSIKHVFKGNDENFMCLRALNFLLPLNLFCAGKILLLNHRLCTDGLLNCITLLLHNDSAVIIRDVLWPVSQLYCGQLFFLKFTTIAFCMNFFPRSAPVCNSNVGNNSSGFTFRSCT